ncbi:MAG: HDOD domain-containing protein [Chloroflexi bacterium]|nr:HDOD domain-containing protein [Chloroflexota bacterium]
MVREIAELRPLGGVASAVLRITDSGRFSAHEPGKVIATDPALSAKVLRLSNSVYYGFPRRLGTVRDAVVLIGFRDVRSAVLASCVMDAVGRAQRIDYRQFWRFSVTVGVLSELAAQCEGGPFEEASRPASSTTLGGSRSASTPRACSPTACGARGARASRCTRRRARRSAIRTRSSAARSRCTGTSRRSSPTRCATTR